jgi:hypothetical protein
MIRYSFLFVMVASLLLAGCGQVQEVLSQPDFIPDNLIPDLELPEGVTLFGGGGGGGDGLQLASFNFNSALGLETIHNHFAEQLRDNGWEAIADPETGENSLTTFWEVFAFSGKTWAAKLQVNQMTQESPYEYRVTLALVNP